MLGKHCQRFFRISHAAPSTWLQGLRTRRSPRLPLGSWRTNGNSSEIRQPAKSTSHHLADTSRLRPQRSALACAARCQRESHHLERRPPAVRESFDPVWARVVPRIAFREDDLRPSIVYLFALAETHPGGDSALTNFVIGHTPSQNCGASPKLLR